MSPAVPQEMVCSVAEVLVLYFQIPASKIAASVLQSPLKSPGAIRPCEEHIVAGGMQPTVKRDSDPPLLFLTLSSLLAECQRPMSAFPSLSKSKSTTLDGCGGAIGSGSIITSELAAAGMSATIGAKNANALSPSVGT